MEQTNNGFSYTYSAAQQQEVEHIRKKYLPPQEDKMEKLRRLHHSTTRKAQSASIALGVMGALILGTGMSLVMTDLGAALGSLSMVLGILVGTLGLVLVGLAYPAYHATLKRERERIAPEILRLSEELLQ